MRSRDGRKFSSISDQCIRSLTLIYGECETGFCGDGIVNTDGGEVCDAGGEGATCDNDCTAVSCGDGTLNAAAG